MRIDVRYEKYNAGGYERTLSLCGWLIEKALTNYGEAVHELWITAYIPPQGPPKATLGSLYDDFNEHLHELPKTRFLRKKRTITIDAETSFVHPPYPSEHLNHAYPQTPELFLAGLREVIRIMQHVRDRVTNRDDFNVEEFLHDVAETISRAPRTTEELEELRKEQFRIIDERQKNADPWERLGIDWDEFHRQSRKLLNDPFFWEQSNELSPNGNDTGADVLIAFQDWRAENKRADPLKWLAELLTGWEVDLAMAPNGSVAKAKASLERDDFSVNTYDDAAIGLAFACLKVDGKLPASIATLALRAIERQSLDTVIENRGWRDAKERKQSLVRVAAVLESHKGS